jgi:hypothetical protein
MSTRMSLDEYMTILQQRADEWLAGQKNPDLRFPPLLDWFVRDGDEDLVELPEERKPEPRPKPQPRRYRPASYWRDRIATLEAQMAPLTEPLINDRAAAGGVALGVKRTAKIQAREDGRLQRYVELRNQLERAQSMLRAAEARKTRTQGGAA